MSKTYENYKCPDCYWKAKQDEQDDMTKQKTFSRGRGNTIDFTSAMENLASKDPLVNIKLWEAFNLGMKYREENPKL